ncbi:MAG: choice-of-anchor tandem repeat GloVer-containing protein, partial [Candidatus Cybelea sp.]
MSAVIGSRGTLFCVAAAALLAGCGGSQPPIGAPGVMSQMRLSGSTRATGLRNLTSSYQVLFRFGRHPNPGHDIGGADPEGLIAVGGELYGTTAAGGYHDFGTVYSMSTVGAKKVLHRFDSGSYGPSDGVNPVGSLIEVKSLLYGVTVVGGKCGSGSVYSISTTGTETILHSFCGSDGIQPLTGLVNVSGTLYGTTQYGASGSNWGTVYSVTTSGTFKTLYTFTDSPDGAEPAAPLLNVKGTLYGTTAYG